MKRKSWPFLLVCMVWLNLGSALADDGFYVVAVGGGVGAKITRLPCTISASGFYYLSGNLTHGSDTPPAITVAADDVTIDLMGFSLSGNAINKGVYLNGGKNLEIRNGTLRNFYDAVLSETADDGHRVVNVRVQGNTYGIALAGGMVKGCTILDNAESGVFLGQGIVTGNVISNNRTGIHTYGATVRGNFISNCIMGIYGKGVMHDNIISYCTGSGVAAWGTISGNTVSNCLVGIDMQQAGSVIGNTVFCASGQTGIKIPTSSLTPVMMNQNTVSGDGAHYTGGGDATVWGINAGR
jgi:hypothetical protein